MYSSIADALQKNILLLHIRHEVSLLIHCAKHLPTTFDDSRSKTLTLILQDILKGVCDPPSLDVQNALA